MKKIKSLIPKIFKKTSPLPEVSVTYNTMVKETQRQLLLGFLIFLLLGLYSFWHYHNQYKAINEPLNVLVFSENIEAPITLESKHLKSISIPKKYLPASYIEQKDKDKIIGQTIQQHTETGQILVLSHLNNELNAESVSAKLAEKYAFVIDESWLVSKFPNIKEEDLVSVLVSNPRADQVAAEVILSDIKVVELNYLKNKRSLTLNLSKAESETLLFAKSLKLPMQIIVHSRQNNPKTP